MDFSTPNFWIMVVLVLLAVAIVWASNRARPIRSGREVAYENGLQYALVELHKAFDKEQVAERLFEEANEGKLQDPSPFDDAILAVLEAYVATRDTRERVLTEAIERLEAMERLGEASSCEVSVGLDVLTKMLHADTEVYEVVQEEVLA